MAETKKQRARKLYATKYGYQPSDDIALSNFILAYTIASDFNGCVPDANTHIAADNPGDAIPSSYDNITGGGDRGYEQAAPTPAPEPSSSSSYDSSPSYDSGSSYSDSGSSFSDGGGGGF